MFAAASSYKSLAAMFTVFFPAMTSIYHSDLPFSYSFDQINNGSILFRKLPALTLSSMSMGGNNGGTRQEPPPGNSFVTQALEIARDSPEGAQDPDVARVLETALSEIWGKIQTQPNSYVMTRDEFAVFNYFQARFEGHELAVSARRRYWDYQQKADGGLS